ncbi:MAG: orotidine-5'-phosphate decarboxylase [Dehalococcoidia bacterium]|nr:orotidine-5'-phosphate decarboxylase [Dehalococcoidia bacterium]
MNTPVRGGRGSFMDLFREASLSNNSLLCLGLDPDPALMPITDVVSFNRAIVEATADLVCAYKPNLAFFEALGWDGLQVLRHTIEAIPKGIPVIGDAKRGDVGHTARAYARALFDVCGFDAVTVNPYLGFDSVEPFISRRDKGVFILCKTSNPGSQDFQALPAGPDARPLYELVAARAREWNTGGNVGLVVGATFPQELKTVRETCPEMLLLIPGIGAQGGDLAWAVREGLDQQGSGAIIAASRQVLYASQGPDFADKARKEALRLRNEINRHRKARFAGRQGR